MLAPRLDSLLVLLVTIGYFICNAAATFHKHDATFEPDIILRATTQNISIDCESRHSVVLNGSSPGPTLYLKEGFTTWIRVYNDIQDDNLTVHWHGLAQRTAPFSDGTPLVSQWPIAPGNFFDYEVHPEVGDAGTYFYHSHVGFQAVSAHGALIVEECGEPPYAYDEDITILLSDYYNRSDAQIIEGLLANPFRWSGETNALLLNGQSGHESLSNATDASCAPLQINVKPDTTYRFRWIGGTAISLVTLGIEDHDNFTIIEADGAYSKPYETDHLQVATGQRFSLLFRTKSAAELEELGKTSFWVRYESRERPANATGYALLNYEVPDADIPQVLPDTSPVTLPARVYDWLEYALEPYDATIDPFPTEPTRTVTIQVNQEGIYINRTFRSQLEWANNGLVWKTSNVQTPYLVSIYQNGAASVPNYDAALANGGWDPATSVFPARIGEVLDIVWESNTGPTGGWDFHPMHAHGGHFWDLGSGNGTYDAETNAARFANYTPILRDTTVLYRYATSGVPHTTAGWRAWRIKVDVAGLWMLHCHILQHMEMGMNTVWSFGDAVQIAEWDPYISSGYLEFGGSAYGNDSYDPVVNHYYPENRGKYHHSCGQKGRHGRPR
jgi:L-ascorbate oxidase